MKNRNAEDAGHIPGSTTCLGGRFLQENGEIPTSAVRPRVGISIYLADVCEKTKIWNSQSYQIFEWLLIEQGMIYIIFAGLGEINFTILEKHERGGKCDAEP